MTTLTTILNAPDRISRRGAVAGILDRLPADVDVLHLLIDGDPTTSPSFFDELIKQLLVTGRVQRLVIGTSDEFLVDLASRAATTYCVDDRLTFASQ